MIDRREILKTLAAIACLAPLGAGPVVAVNNILEWPEFVEHMRKLTIAHELKQVSQSDMEDQGLALMSRLDFNSAAFKAAVDSSFESGNLFWMWQRLIKERRLKGGILNIEKSQFLNLHDHPGATGMVRVISGETEAWVFDRSNAENQGDGETRLELVFHGILKPGDTAKVTPGKNNIHALRAVSEECAMLDFFIPPYDRSRRYWFEPTKSNWFDDETITAIAIPQHVYGQ